MSRDRGQQHTIYLKPEVVSFLRAESKRMKLPQGLIITKALAAWFKPDARNTRRSHEYRLVFGEPPEGTQC